MILLLGVRKGDMSFWYFKFEIRVILFCFFFIGCCWVVIIIEGFFIYFLDICVFFDLFELDISVIFGRVCEVLC